VISTVILSNGPEIPWLCHGMTIRKVVHHANGAAYGLDSANATHQCDCD